MIANTASTTVAMAVISPDRSTDMGEAYCRVVTDMRKPGLRVLGFAGWLVKDDGYPFPSPLV